MEDDFKQQEGAALKALFDKHPGTKKAFATTYDVPGGASMLSQNISGNRPISLDGAHAYATGLGVSVAEFSPRLAKVISKMASTMSGAALVARDSAPEHTPLRGMRVPLLANAASMGSGADIEHDDVMLGQITLATEWVDKRVRPSTASALRFIHAYGDSMSPTLNDGDVLLVDTGRRDPSGADGIYVLSTSERLYVKRVTERMGGGFDVTSDNPAVKTTQTLNGDSQIRVLGRVIWVWNGRKI